MLLKYFQKALKLSIFDYNKKILYNIIGVIYIDLYTFF